MFHQLIAAYLGLAIGTSVAQIAPPIPVPNEIPGQRYPHDSVYNPKVRLEVFIALTCSDSATELPIVEQVADYYGPAALELIIHQLPLPYQRNAVIEAQGLYVIRDNMPDQSFNYMHELFNNLILFSNTGTSNLVDSQVLDRLAVHANAATGIDETFFKNEIGAYNSEVRVNWKFGVNRGVAGTPWFFLNGVDLSVVGNPTYEEWIAYLDPIILG